MYHGGPVGCEEVLCPRLPAQPHLVMAGRQLYKAARDGRVDNMRRLLDQGVHPDELFVSAAPAAAGGRMC